MKGACFVREQVGIRIPANVHEARAIRIDRWMKLLDRHVRNPGVRKASQPSCISIDCEIEPLDVLDAARRTGKRDGTPWRHQHPASGRLPVARFDEKKCLAADQA